VPPAGAVILLAELSTSCQQAPFVAPKKKKKSWNKMGNRRPSA